MLPQLALKVLCISICAKEILCSNIKRFEIATGAVHFDTGGNNVTFELFWNDNQYVCGFVTHLANTIHTCNASTWIHTSNVTHVTDARFFMKVRYHHFTIPFVFESIKVTSVDDIFYTLDTFCIPPAMQYKINSVINGTNALFQNCHLWESKIRYNATALGGITDFKLLYIYFPNTVEYFTTTYLEGSIAPPLLTSIGFTTGTVGSGTSTPPFIINVIQWDQAFYQCDTLSGHLPSTNYSCTPTALICPDAQSNFWFSIYVVNSVSFHSSISTIIVQDETQRIYEVGEFCVNGANYAPAPTSATNCTQQVNGVVISEITLSNNGMFPQFWSGVAGYFNSSIFADITGPGERSAAFNIMENTFILLGLNVPIECPPTNAPSPNPTVSPTTAPPLPSNAPSASPTLAPTSPPTLAPIQGCSPTTHNDMLYHMNGLNSGFSCIDINKDLWNGDIWYSYDMSVISLSGELHWIESSLMGSTQTGLVGTIVNNNAWPRITETFTVTNDRGLSISIELNIIGRISVRSWTLPIAFYSNVGDANGKGKWYYIEQVYDDNVSFAKSFKIHSGHNTTYDTNPWQLHDLMRISLDGITYISKAADPTVTPTLTPIPTTESIATSSPIESVEQKLAVYFWITVIALGFGFCSFVVSLGVWYSTRTKNVTSLSSSSSSSSSSSASSLSTTSTKNTVQMT